MKHLIILISFFAIAHIVTAQQLYTRTFRTDSIGAAKWQIVETETYANAISAGDTAKTITQRPLRFESRKEMLDFLRGQRQIANDQKAAFQKRIIELDSQIQSIRRILRGFGDNSNSANREVLAPAQPKNTSAAVLCPCDMYVTTRTQKDECISYLKVLQDMGIEAPKKQPARKPKKAPKK